MAPSDESAQKSRPIRGSELLPPAEVSTLQAPSRAVRARSAPRDELLSIIEVCEELGIARATFYRWRAHRKGPASLRLPNGTVRIRRSALTAFIAACEDTTR
ncbi:putative DNA-binding transcriptional regulator AlpA [Catenulispora sp. EB89]|uniref:helix-turn-helix transcriptional regulator n=1 Tax=Catenulispora sp. EB89 TaxID=3156257 RepID=UPI003512EEF5